MESKDRELIHLTDRIYFYSDDPVKLLYYSKEVGSDGKPRLQWLKFCTRIFSTSEMDASEQSIVESYRDVGDLYAKDGSIGTAESKHATELMDTIVRTSLSPDNAKSYLQRLGVLAGSGKSDIPESKDEALRRKAERTVENIKDRIAQPGSSAFEAFDALDSDQIVSYFESTITQEFFYTFPVDGKPVTGISYAGTIEAAKAVAAKRAAEGMGGIDVLSDIVFIDLSDRYRCIVRAKDLALGLTIPGFNETKKFRQVCVERDPKTKKCIRYEGKEDSFAATICVSKATRNALRHLIPEKEILGLYQMWLRKKQIKGE